MKRRENRYVSFFCIMTLLNFIFSLSCSIISPLCPAWGAEKNKIEKLPFTSNAGIMLCTDNGTVLYSQNANKGFVPASVIKVVTSLSARYYLGKDYRFKTHFFIENFESLKRTKKNDKSNYGASSDYSNINLKVKGYGDPLFTSEIIHNAAGQVSSTLKSMNIFTINNIIVDSSFFAPNIQVDGTSNTNNPYDAYVGALSANFNTVAFKYDKTKKVYVSDDPEIPLFPFVVERVKSSWFDEDRVILSEKESKIYAGMLIKYFLLKEGFKIKGEVKTGVATDSDKLICEFTSPYSMDEIIRRLLKYSNNFMANQLFLSAGAKAFSPPATVEKGVAAMKNYARKFMDISESVFAEGSGLSRQNRISPSDMVKVLKKFRPDYQLMKNENMPDGVIEYYKTGTLTGVRTRCGYFETSQGLYPFVIMINAYGSEYDKIRQFLCKTVLSYEGKK